jgi:hypothetical protein
VRLSSAVFMWLFPFAVLLVASGTLAQQAPAPDQSSPPPAISAPSRTSNADKPENAPSNSPTANPITVQGCINGGKQGYTLMQQGTAAAFELQSRSYQLKNARGKVVQITGREISPRSDSNGLPQLQVEAMQILSDHCELPGKASGASTTVRQGNTNPNTTAPPDAATPKYDTAGAPQQTPPSQGNNPTTWGRTSGAPSPGTGNPPPSQQQPPPKL